MNPISPSRRKFLQQTLATSGLLLFDRTAVAQAAAPVARIGLGFSLYGMKSLTIHAGLKACAEIGYDCVELPVLADWPADVRRLSVEQQKQIRDALQHHNLRLTALMENLKLLADEPAHRDNLERLKLAAELAHALVPGQPPVIETVLGGSPAKWNEVKSAMVDRLAEWARVAAETKTILAIKPHVGNSLHTAVDAAWIIRQVNNPALRAAYDYSHFALRGIDMAESVRTLIPLTSFIHVKDEQGTSDKFQFLLPGDGQTDYVKLLQLVHAAGYAGDVMVEVSGQIHSRPNYDPLAAAQRCYAHLAAAFEKAMVKRD